MSLSQDRSTSTSRACVLVMGMHRSGTSAFTRMINLLGADLPAHLMPKSPSNPKGHWESAPIAHLNDAIFKELHSSWWDLLPLEFETLGAQSRRTYEREISELIQGECSGSELFVIKDPRICRLLPLWRRALKQLDCVVRCVVVFRHPHEVARSLEQRDAIPFRHGCLLWLRYYLDVERETRGMTRTFLAYDKLLDEPRSVAHRLAPLVLGGESALGNTGNDSVWVHVDPALRHHSASLEDLSERDPIDPWLIDAMGAFEALTKEPHDSSAQSTLSSVASSIDGSVGRLAPLLADYSSIAPARGREVKQLASRNRFLTRRNAVLAQKNSDLARANSTRAKEISDLKKNNRTLASKIEALRLQAKKMQQAVYRSTSWRITKPIRALGRVLGRRR